MSTSRWTRLRWAQLKTQPICERCDAYGKSTIATEIHHKIPIERARTDREMERLCFDPDNLASMCGACHRLIHVEMFSHSAASIKANQKRETDRFANKYLNVADDE